MPMYVAAMTSVCSLLPVWGEWDKDLCIGDSSSSPAKTLNSPHGVVTPCLFSKQVRVIPSDVSLEQTICFDKGVCVGGELPSDELCECLPLGLDFSAQGQRLIPPRYCPGYSATAVLSLKDVIS